MIFSWSLYYKNIPHITLEQLNIEDPDLFIIPGGTPENLYGCDLLYSKIREMKNKDMLSLSLPIAKELGIKRALITCDKGNIGSEKTIKNNGRVLENEIEQQGGITQRYWINL